MGNEAATVIRYRDGRTERTGDDVEIDRDGGEIRIGGSEARSVSIDELKAVFFLEGSDDDPRPEQGSLVRVEFEDGEEITGVAPEYNPSRRGFFMYPTDSERISRIFVITSAVQSIEVERF